MFRKGIIGFLFLNMLFTEIRADNFGIYGAGNLTNAKLEQNSQNRTITFRPGYYLGIFSEYKLFKRLYFVPGFGLDFRQFEYERDDEIISREMYSFRLPFLLSYNFLHKNRGYFIRAGADVQVGLKWMDKSSNSSVNLLKASDSNDPDFQSVNIDLNAEFGYQFNRIQLSLYVGVGTNDQDRAQTSVFRMWNTGIKLAYLIKRD